MISCLKVLLGPHFQIQQLHQGSHDRRSNNEEMVGGRQVGSSPTLSFSSWWPWTRCTIYSRPCFKLLLLEEQKEAVEGVWPSGMLTGTITLPHWRAWLWQGSQAHRLRNAPDRLGKRGRPGVAAALTLDGLEWMPSPQKLSHRISPCQLAGCAFSLASLASDSSLGNLIIIFKMVSGENSSWNKVSPGNS